MSLTPAPASRPHTRTRTGPRSRLRLRLRLSLAALLGASCLGGLLLAPATGAAADNDSGLGSGGGSERALQQQLEDLVGTPGGPPGVIVVLQRERTSRVLRAGVADLETGRPIEPTDHMRIASTAKAFSGAVALRLVQRGTLGLDSTVGRTLPQLPRAWRSVTLRQLLNHTSGLPDYTEDPEFLELLLADPRRTFDPHAAAGLRRGRTAALPPRLPVPILQLRQHRRRADGGGGGPQAVRGVAAPASSTGPSA